MGKARIIWTDQGYCYTYAESSDSYLRKIGLDPKIDIAIVKGWQFSIIGIPSATKLAKRQKELAECAKDKNDYDYGDEPTIQEGE